MSHCPTCGHRADDELVHSTPSDEPRRSAITARQQDLTDLIALVRRVVVDDQRATDRRLKAERRTNGRRGRAIQLRRVA